MKCPWGCGWKGKTEEYAEHLKKCPRYKKPFEEKFLGRRVWPLELEKKEQALEVMMTFVAQEEPLKSLAKGLIASTLDTYQRRFGLTGIDLFSEDYAREVQRRNIITFTDLEPFWQAVKQYLEAI